ncbi:MAG: hypothetical protein ACHQSE_09875 [Gemmatimonadales bacterium]
MVRLAVALVAATFAAVVPPSGALAQQRTVRVLGDDGEPVAYANVTLAGERARITNEAGDVGVGTAGRPAVAVDVRRLGYEPWYGTLALGDTQMIARVTLHRITRRMFTVKVTDSSRVTSFFLRGFYERMLARQRGIGSGIYLTPEEVDKRNAGVPTALLQGINGVSLHRTPSGKLAAMNSNGSCQMTILIDGHVVCPEGGCDHSASSTPPPPPARRSSRTFIPRTPPGNDQFVVLDDVVSANDVAAVEVYPRGASVPASLPTVNSSCGVVALWTGGRTAP